MKSRIAIALLTFGVLVSRSARGDIYTQLDLKVNVLPGNAQTDADINTLVNEVNRIFAKCGRISFTPAKINRLGALPAGFRDLGGGKVLAGGGNPAKRDQDAAANAEIRNGGFKIFLADSLEQPNGNTTNGATWTGNGSSLITERNGIHGDGQTWAHEIAHGLGINDHSADIDNVMFEFRENAQGRAAGTNLTETQCQQIIAGYLRRSPSIEVTVDQEGLVPEERHGTTVLTSALPAAPGTTAPVEGFDWLAPHEITFLFRGAPTPDRLEITLDLRAAFPRSGALRARYDILLDIDGDAASGTNIGASTGVDAIVSVEFSGVWPFQPPDGQRTATVTLTGGAAAPGRIDAPEILARRQSARPRRPPAVESEDDDRVWNEAIRVTVPLAALGTLRNNVRAGVEAATERAVVSVPQQDVPTRIARPGVSTTDRRVRSGAIIPLNGERFRAGGSVRVFWAHDFSRPVTTARVDREGRFSTQIRIPRVPPGDYVVDAVGDTGEVAITVLAVQPEAVASDRRTLLIVIALLTLLAVVLILMMLRLWRRAQRATK